MMYKSYCSHEPDQTDEANFHAISAQIAANSLPTLRLELKEPATLEVVFSPVTER